MSRSSSSETDPEPPETEAVVRAADRLPNGIDTDQTVVIPQSALNGRSLNYDGRYHAADADGLTPACQSTAHEGAALPAWAAADAGLSVCQNCCEVLVARAPGDEAYADPEVSDGA